jgi:hypothetical protein
MNSTIYPWNTVTAQECTKFRGTLEWKGEELKPGMILSHDHEAIPNIIRTIRNNHVESELLVNTALSYNPSVNYVRFSCPRGTTFLGTLNTEVRGPSRHIEGLTDKCCFALNLSWSMIGNQSAWRVGKVSSCHDGHCARTQQLARPTPEQTELLGAQMVDTNLSAAQVES